MANNVIREQQLQSVASTAQSFSLDTQNQTLGIVIEALQIADDNAESSGGTGKTVPTIILTPEPMLPGFTVAYNGDGELRAVLGTLNNDSLMPSGQVMVGTSRITKGVLYSFETENFAPAVVEFDLRS